MRDDADQLETLCINTVRFMAADAVQKARSGHPGAPMGAAPMAFVLWDEFLRHNPRNPGWSNRDRFVLSAGHASMLLYSLLHLTGYDLSIEDLESFRQWSSKTPGHPEYGHTPGVEATTGPLGQGLANAVGMAIAEAHLAARYNREGHKIVDHNTYVLAGDGDLMEGVTSEACSLAGHLRLGKLIVLYDDNKVSLAGSTSLSFTEDVAKRFESYGWGVGRVEDGNNTAAVRAALRAAKDDAVRPSLIAVRTVIGYGAPNVQGSYKTHGSPLGDEELAAAKRNLGWPVEPTMFVPPHALARFRKAVERGAEIEKDWDAAFDAYAADHPAEAEEFARTQMGGLPGGWDSELPVFEAQESGPATRVASEAAIQALAARLPELVGGSADLNPSTFTWIKGGGDFESPELPREGAQGAVGGSWDYSGRNIHFGVREHAMGAVAGGMALHGGLIPFTGTFLVFSDYMRPPMRLAAMSCLRVIYVFTHDSIGVGEDGPTHEPVEQVMNLRAVPNLTVIRPADANETVEAWRAAVKNAKGPTALVLTRQKLPVLERAECASALGLSRGAYALWSSGEKIELIILATGSEVHIALEGGRKLAERGVGVRVVSMPSWELFEAQSDDYKELVLPPSVRARVAVEAGLKAGWERYVGLDGATVGMEGFGASAPAGVLYEKFGITAEAVVAAATRVLERQR